MIRNSKYFSVPALSFAISIAAAAPSYAQENLAGVDQNNLPADQVFRQGLRQEGVEVLQSGPMHEAFAEQVNLESQDPFVVDEAPPEPIEELPPEHRPEGDNVVWIPGYWGWDIDRNKYVWISGVWRNVPPNRSWVPGYWAKADAGWVWVSGFWERDDIASFEYLPAPPPSFEQGPTTEALVADQIWIPGQWQYTTRGYAWRPGYWTDGREGWVWVNARYVWTPTGYLYCPGYWDYGLAERGVLFCPIVLSQPSSSFRYQPHYIVDIGPALLANLFVCPRYNHYYYGAYYDYRGTALVPWSVYSQIPVNYDPLYSSYYYYGVRRTALNQILRLHRYIATNATYQPTWTLQDQVARVQNIPASQRAVAMRAVSLQETVEQLNQNDFDLNFVPVEQAAIRSATNLASEFRQAVTERARVEQPEDEVDRQRAGVQRDRFTTPEGQQGEQTTNVFKPKSLQIRRPNVSATERDRESVQDMRGARNNDNEVADANRDTNRPALGLDRSNRSQTPAARDQVQVPGDQVQDRRSQALERRSEAQNPRESQQQNVQDRTLGASENLAPMTRDELRQRYAEIQKLRREQSQQLQNSRQNNPGAGRDLQGVSAQELQQLRQQMRGRGNGNAQRSRGGNDQAPDAVPNQTPSPPIPNVLPQNRRRSPTIPNGSPGNSDAKPGTPGQNKGNQ